jgi:hypothetical protein
MEQQRRAGGFAGCWVREEARGGGKSEFAGRMSMSIARFESSQILFFLMQQSSCDF